MPDIQSEYVFYTDAFNYEAVEWEPVSSGDMRVQWKAAGTGSLREPEVTIVDGVIEVRGTPVRKVGSNHTTIVTCGAKMPVKIIKSGSTP